MKRIRNSLRSKLCEFKSNKKGIAAVEFALLLPLLIIVGFGVIEVYFRYQAEDQFSRYIFQAGDLAAREATLTTADVGILLESSQKMMKEVDTANLISLRVSSLGFDKNNSPILLWTRSIGGNIASPAANDAIGLGKSGETVLRMDATFVYKSPMQIILPNRTITKIKHAYFRPRLTRAIAMDSNIAELNPNWDQGVL